MATRANRVTIPMTLQSRFGQTGVRHRAGDGPFGPAQPRSQPSRAPASRMRNTTRPTGEGKLRAPGAIRGRAAPDRPVVVIVAVAFRAPDPSRDAEEGEMEQFERGGMPLQVSNTSRLNPANGVRVRS